jgi:chromosome segregation ATPase
MEQQLKKIKDDTSGHVADLQRRLEGQLEQERRARSELENKGADVNAQAKILADQLTRMKKEHEKVLAELETQRVRASKHRTELDEQKLKLEKQRSELEQQFQQADKARQTGDRNRGELEKQVGLLDKRRQQLEAAVIQSEQKAQDLQSQLIHAEKKRGESASAEVRQARDEAEKAKSALASSQRRIEDLEEQVANLEQAVNAGPAIGANDRTQMVPAAGELGALLSERDKLRADVTSLKKKLVNAEAAIELAASLRSKVAKLEQLMKGGKR